MNQNDWVSVDTKLPPKDETVLINKWDPRPGVCMNFVGIGEYRRDGKWWYTENEVQVEGKCGRVTHWAYIPEPPTERVSREDRVEMLQTHIEILTDQVRLLDRKSRELGKPVDWGDG